MSTTYNNPIMLDSTGQDIVDKLDSIASLMGDGVIDDTSTTATDKTWSASKINSEATVLENGVIANTKLIKDTVGWSGKNKFNSDNAVKVNDFVSANNNGIISFKDVSTAQWSSSYIGYFDVVAGTTYLLTGTNAAPYGRFALGLSATNHPASAYDPHVTIISGTSNIESFGLQNPVKYTANATERIYLWYCSDVNIGSHTTFSTGIMNRKADILDDTYEPYFGSTAFPRSEQAALGAKNIWDDSIALSSNASATVTKTTDGYAVQTNTTANSGGQFNQTPLHTRYTPFGNITVSFEYKSDIACAGYIGKSDVTLATDWTKVSYSADGSTMGAICFYNRDTTKTPLIEMRNMMITLVSDTDLTYVSPAMTNRELTEQLNAIFAESLNDGTTFNIPYKRKSDGRNTSGLIVMSGGLYHYFLRPTDQSNTVDVNKILDVNGSRSATGSFANDILTITFNATVPGGITLLTGNRA